MNTTVTLHSLCTHFPARNQKTNKYLIFSGATRKRGLRGSQSRSTCTCQRLPKFSQLCRPTWSQSVADVRYHRYQQFGVRGGCNINTIDTVPVDDSRLGILGCGKFMKGVT